MQCVKRPACRPIQQIDLPLQRIDVREKHPHQECCEQQAEREYALRHANLIGRSVGTGTREETRRSSRLRTCWELLLQKKRAPRTNLAAPIGSPQTTHKTNHLGLCGTQKCPRKLTEVLVAKKVVGGRIRGVRQGLRAASVSLWYYLGPYVIWLSELGKFPECYRPSQRNRLRHCT